MVELLILIFLSIIVAIWSIQIASESVLALRIKNFFRLTQPYPRSLDVFCHFKTWRRLIGTAFYLLMPLVFLIVVLLRLHRFISEILECPYCQSTWYMGFTLYFLIGLPLVWSIFLAPLPILSIYIIERIRK